MTVQSATTRIFDGDAFIEALDAQRKDRGLTWNELAGELSQQSAELTARLGGDALCPGALHRTSLRKTMTCHYALPLLRWIHRAPEDFIPNSRSDLGDTRLLEPGPDRRLRWNLPKLYGDLAQRRHERGLTWAGLAATFGCTPNRLTNLKTARLADLGLVMQITQWLGEPAARYIYVADW